MSFLMSLRQELLINHNERSCSLADFKIRSNNHIRSCPFHLSFWASFSSSFRPWASSSLGSNRSQPCSRMPSSWPSSVSFKSQQSSSSWNQGKLNFKNKKTQSSWNQGERKFEYQKINSSSDMNQLNMKKFYLCNDFDNNFLFF